MYVGGLWRKQDRPSQAEVLMWPWLLLFPKKNELKPRDKRKEESRARKGEGIKGKPEEVKELS